MILLQVSRDKGATWGTLQKFHYDDANKFQTRKAAMAHAVKARMRWADNYAQYRDATFRIVESDNVPKPLARVADEPKIAPVDNTYASIAPGYRPALNAYSAASILGRRR